jgi:hypothetical protein
MSLSSPEVYRLNLICIGGISQLTESALQRIAALMVFAK